MKALTRASIPVMALCILLLLGGCMRYGIGDPEKSSVQQKYAGNWVWESSDGQHLAMLHPWDARSYALRYITLSHQPGQKKIEQFVLKAWLTQVEGEALITLEARPDISAPPADLEKRFLVLKLNLTTDRLIATSINPSFPPFEAAVSAEDLEGLVRKYLNDPAAWTDQPISARRASDAEMKQILGEMERAAERNP